MARIPNVLGTTDLSMAELCAARIDGDLTGLHDAFVPIDEPDLPELRATALAAGLDRSLILDRRSAAWVHGVAAAPPRVPQLCRSAARRGTVDPGAPPVRELVMSVDDLVEIAGVPCTSLIRTAYDLLRDPGEPGDEVEQIVGRLLHANPDLEPAIRARLAATKRLPYRALADARLARAVAVALEAQPSATR